MLFHVAAASTGGRSNPFLHIDGSRFLGELGIALCPEGIKVPVVEAIFEVGVKDVAGPVDRAFLAHLPHVAGLDVGLCAHAHGHEHHDVSQQ